MPSTTGYKRGEVVLVPFPFTDLSSVKQRPALVVSADKFNATRSDVVVIAITSQVPLKLAEDELAVPATELAAWGLPKPSILKLTKLFSIHQGLIRKSLGRASDSSLGAVLRQLQKQFDV
jgi:mRNA interferase MazF